MFPGIRIMCTPEEGLPQESMGRADCRLVPAALRRYEHTISHIKAHLPVPSPHQGEDHAHQHLYNLATLSELLRQIQCSLIRTAGLGMSPTPRGPKSTAKGNLQGQLLAIAFDTLRRRGQQGERGTVLLLRLD